MCCIHPGKRIKQAKLEGITLKYFLYNYYEIALGYDSFLQMQGSLRVIKIIHYLFKAVTHRLLPIVEFNEVREKLFSSHWKSNSSLLK